MLLARYLVMMPKIAEASVENSPSRPTGIHLPTFLFFLFVHLCALGISAGRFPFLSHFPHNGETFALGVMLTAQILSISILSPLLMRSFSSSLVAIAIAWPMAELAAFIADVPAGRAALAEGYVSIWIFVLMLWIR